MGDPTRGGASSITFEELEQQAAVEEAAGKQPKMLETKLEGDDVPEELRGQSIKDIIARLKGREEALRLSEVARLEAAGRTVASPAALPIEEPVELTDEQIAEMHSEEPLKAIQAVTARSERRMAKNLETRLGPLVTGTAASVEAAARAKYPEEFELFGADISKIASNIPNARAALTDPTVWDGLISYARGQPENFEKLMARKLAKSGAPTREVVQRQQVEEVGFTGSSGKRPVPVQGAPTLDLLQKEIAAKLSMSDAEYIKWMGVS